MEVIGRAALRLDGEAVGGLRAQAARRQRRTSGEIRRARARVWVAYAALAIVVCAAYSIAVLAAGRSTVVVQGGGGMHGRWIDGVFAGMASTRLQPSGFHLLVGAMAVGYLVALALARELRLRWLVAAVGLAHCALLLAPPLLSTDVFNYIDYARLGSLHGFDPYIHGPVAAPTDPAFVHTAWRHTGAVYGPLFTLATYPLGHVSVAGALWAFKALAALCSLGCVGLVGLIARRTGISPVAAVATVGLNPILLVWAVGGAHNDLLMLMLMLGAVALALVGRERAGGVALMAAAAIKVTAGLALPLFLLGVRRRAAALTGVVVAAALIYLAAARAFPGHPLGVIHVLHQQSKLVGYTSMPKQIVELFGAEVTPTVQTVMASALGIGCVWLAVGVWRGRDWIAATGWAMLAIVVTTTWFVAWYSIWPLAFAAFARDRRLLVATLTTQGFFLANHIAHFTM